MKAFFQKYKHAWVLLYGFIYLPWFFWLESRANQPYHVIHVWLDDKIPFVEYFIVPYLLWFVYIAAVSVLQGNEKRVLPLLFLPVYRNDTVSGNLHHLSERTPAAAHRASTAQYLHLCGADSVPGGYPDEHFPEYPCIQFHCSPPGCDE